jgi:O-acetyl-ADP-ribose deacetylase (regulator of RNase III)
MGILPFELNLVALDFDLEQAFVESFSDHPEVRILSGDLLGVAEDTVVSPANSVGLMDGGIDKAYIRLFGLRPQNEYMEGIRQRAEGLMPVGAAVLVNTGHPKISKMICAPTMRVPEKIPAANVFFAMAAMLEVAWENRARIKKVFCPGMGTGTGCVEPAQAVAEMERAYRKWKKKHGL